MSFLRIVAVSLFASLAVGCAYQYPTSPTPSPAVPAPVQPAAVVAAPVPVPAAPPVAVPAPAPAPSQPPAPVVPPAALWLGVSAFSTEVGHAESDAHCTLPIIQGQMPTNPIAGCVPITAPVRTYGSVLGGPAFVSCVVDFGDRVSVPGVVSGATCQAEHLYGVAGWHTIAMSVTASDGRTASNTVQLLVQ